MHFAYISARSLSKNLLSVRSSLEISSTDAMIFCLNLDCIQGANLEGSKFCQRCGQPLILELGQRYHIKALLHPGHQSRSYVAELLQSEEESPDAYFIRQFDLTQSTNQQSEFAELFFTQEIQKIIALDPHPAIASLLDHIKEGPYHFLVYPYISGKGLNESPDTENYTDKHVKAVLTQLLPALEFIHSKGIVHGEIGASRVLRQDPDGSMMLVGLGENITLRLIEHRGGTPKSPEVSLTDQEFNIDLGKPSADIYNLGLLCSQLLPTQILTDQMLHHVIAKMMSWSIDERYQNATDVLRDLAAGDIQLQNTDPLTPPKQPSNPTPVDQYPSWDESDNVLPEQAALTQGNPTDAATWTALGKTLLQSEQYNEAAAAFDSALKLAPKLEEAWLGRGYALFKQNRYQESVAAYDQVFHLCEQNAGYWFIRGIALQNLNRFEDALVALDHALAHDPGNGWTWHQKGRTLSQMGRFKDAIAAYEQAQKSLPHYEPLSREKAVAQEAFLRQSTANRDRLS